jgi:hypothetical protein
MRIPPVVNRRDFLLSAGLGIGAADPVASAERGIDGRDLWPLMSGQSKKSPHEAFYYYYGPQLQAVRSGKWKLFLPLEERWVSLLGKTAKSELATISTKTSPRP